MIAPARRQDAVGYIRVSSREQQEEGVSLEAQEARIWLYCQLHSLNLVRIYRDEAVSAGKVPLARRPQGKQLVQAIHDGEVQNVVGVKLDRLFRSALDCLHHVEEWQSGGAGLHLIDFGGQAIDTRSAAGKLFITMLAAFAEFERNVTAERTRDALAGKSERGEWIGRPPFGFDCPDEDGTTLRPNARELEAVELILRRRRGRGQRSFAKIAEELQRRGYHTREGGAWTASTVQGIWQRRQVYRSTLSSERVT